MKRKYTFDDAQKGIKGTPYVPTEAEKDEAVKLYFSEMANRFELHKANGGTVFDFEPNRKPPEFNAPATAPTAPAGVLAHDPDPEQDADAPAAPRP